MEGFKCNGILLGIELNPIEIDPRIGFMDFRGEKEMRVECLTHNLGGATTPTSRIGGSS